MCQRTAAYNSAALCPRDVASGSALPVSARATANSTAPWLLLSLHLGSAETRFQEFRHHLVESFTFRVATPEAAVALTP